jgi:hypothetical protein
MRSLWRPSLGCAEHGPPRGHPDANRAAGPRAGAQSLSNARKVAASAKPIASAASGVGRGSRTPSVREAGRKASAAPLRTVSDGIPCVLRSCCQ